MEAIRVARLFGRMKDDLESGQIPSCRAADEAVRGAGPLAVRHAGIIACSMNGDEESDHYGTLRTLCEIGDIPEL